ncbi:partial Putative thioredoxin 2, partial [Rhodocyclaceae bacterium]
MATIELTTENFKETISGNDIVIIDFWASWCAPCRSFAPTFEAASEKYADIAFAKVNTEEQQELAGAFNIRSIPTLMVFREQVILFAEAGALPAAAELSRMEKEDNIKSKARAEELARIAEEAVKTAEAKFKAEQAAKE